MSLRPKTNGRGHPISYLSFVVMMNNPAEIAILTLKEIEVIKWVPLKFGPKAGRPLYAAMKAANCSHMFL
jgi:hypothetical protein